MIQKIRQDVSIGDNMKELRNKSGLSQESLCALLRDQGCNLIRSTLEKYELGELNVKVTVLAVLRTIYGCRWDDFFVGVKD